MRGQEILTKLNTLGIHVTALTSADYLSVWPSERLTGDLRAMLRKHKPELLRLLRSFQDVPTFKVRASGGPFYYDSGPPGCHLVFRCPECDRKIYHGGVYRQKGKADGHRHSHCECWPRGYYIREV